jgi:hypothetical protein
MTPTFKLYSLFFLIVAFAAGTEAYDHPLESSAIRDAYFLGTDNYRSVEFLSTYLKKLPVPESGPYVSEMAVRTPFAQVVANSRDHSVGYSAQQAEQDYRKSPSAVQVRIQILTGNYEASSPLQPTPDCQGVQRMNSALGCFHDFRFRFAQDKQLLPQSSYGVPIYGADGSVLIGGDVWFTFRTAEIASAPLRVTVTTPDGRKVSTDFDLTALR